MQMTFGFTRKDTEVIKETQEKLYSADRGVQELNDGELIQLILGSGEKSHSLEELVSRLLSHKNNYGFKDLAPQELMGIEGITERKAEQIIAAIELGRRVYHVEKVVGERIGSPHDAANVFQELKYYNQEHFVAAFLNTKNVVIAKKTIFVGSLNASIVHPRELFHEAVKRSAASVIVAHGHPSGDPTPSREDIEVTKRLKEAGQIMGIEVLDHIIIGNPGYISLKEKGYL